MDRKRVDDTPEVIVKRISAYHEKTMPTLKYLKENFDFYEINGDNSIENVNMEVLDILGFIERN